MRNALIVLTKVRLNAVFNHLEGIVTSRASLFCAAAAILPGAQQVRIRPREEGGEVGQRTKGAATRHLRTLHGVSTLAPALRGTTRDVTCFCAGCVVS